MEAGQLVVDLFEGDCLTVDCEDFDVLVRTALKLGSKTTQESGDRQADEAEDHDHPDGDHAALLLGRFAKLGNGQLGWLLELRVTANYGIRVPGDREG